MTGLPDLTLAGMNSTSGGRYNDIVITGMGSIYGDVECRSLNITGKGTVKGNISASSCVVSGDGKVTGEVDSDNIESSGNLRISGRLKAGLLKCGGRCAVHEGIRAQRIETSGLLKANNGVETEEFFSEGALSVKGLLNANEITVSIEGFCHMDEMGGERIRVRLGKIEKTGLFARLIISLFAGSDKKLNKLTAGTIEGTDIDVEHTWAKAIRGDRIKLGPGCRVDRIEYTETLEVDPGSEVKQKTKI